MKPVRGNNSIDMTTGPLFGKILIFILPLIATNLLHTLYNAADIMIVGLSSEADAVGAVGSTGSFITLIVNIFIGVSVGSDVIVARYIGARDDEKTSEAVHTSICMSLIFGIVGGTIGFVLSKPILIAMGYTGNLLRLGVIYARIYCACLPFLSMTSFLSAILRAKGDTKTPLYIMLGSGALNVGLNCFFVLVLNYSVEGVAIATAISNAVSAAIMWIVLSRDEAACRVSFKKLRISRKLFGEMCYIGLPAGIQNAFFSISNMLIQSSILQIDNAITPIGSSYAPVVKANSAGASIEGFCFAPLNAVTQAASTFTSQNVGVKDYKRVKKVFSSIFLIGCSIGVFMTLLTVLLREPLYALYDIRNLDDELSRIAYNTAMTRVWWKWVPFIFYAMMQGSAGVVRGLGKSILSASVSLIGTCVFRVVWIYTAFRMMPTLEVLYVSYPLSWALSAVAFFIATGVILKKKIKAQNKTEELAVVAEQ